MVQAVGEESQDGQKSSCVEIEIIGEGIYEIDLDFLKDVIDQILVRMELAPCDDIYEGRLRIIELMCADTVRMSLEKYDLILNQAIVQVALDQ